MRGDAPGDAQMHARRRVATYIPEIRKGTSDQFLATAMAWPPAANKSQPN